MRKVALILLFHLEFLGLGDLLLRHIPSPPICPHTLYLGADPVVRHVVSFGARRCSAGSADQESPGTLFPTKPFGREGSVLTRVGAVGFVPDDGAGGEPGSFVPQAQDFAALVLDAPLLGFKDGSLRSW